MTTFGYTGTNRHLVKQVTHTLTGKPTITTSFTYDAIGNRLSMADGAGSVVYSYNQLSQLTSETRNITGLASFTLSYAYNLSGQLSSITDPFGAQVGYSHDKVGRLSAITGSNFASVSTYASNLQYRAWGALKSLSYGNSNTLALGYDVNQNVTSFEIPGIMKKSYQYYDDGRLKFTQEQLITNSKFDRLYKYDHFGRITTALTGAEARGGGPTNDRPYNETMTYDALGHLTLRTVRQWDRLDSTGGTYTNNRRVGWQYDADGRLLSGDSNYTYDATGQILTFGEAESFETDQQLDGDGRRIKSVQRRYDLNTSKWVTEKTTYYIHSSVIGQVISEVSEEGHKERSFVFSGDSVFAVQSVTPAAEVLWKHYDPSNASYRPADSSGTPITFEGAEMDPLGANAGVIKPFTWPPSKEPGILEPYYGIPELNSAYGGCVLDGIPAPCSVVTEGNSKRCDNDQCRTYSHRQGRVVEYHASSDGREGYLPLGWSWTGTGFNANGTFLTFVDGIPQEPAKPSHDKNSGQGPQTACHIMADVAQNEADTAMYQNPNNFNAALTQFDRTFSTLYVGGPMVSLAEARRLSRGDLRTINPNEPFTGGSGFRDEYKDSGSEPPPIGGPNADQTHHFAAFLSLGINRQSAIYGYRHYVQGDNQGDLNLGQAAFRLGTQLRRRGNMSTLTQIGAIIRRTFCDGPGHGLYLN